jgi:SAM-dependent methyltransferase
VSRPTTYSFRRYLAAKERVDDRALHRPTLDRVETDLRERARDRAGPARVLEVGAGLGSMLRRLVEWDRLPSAVEYTAIDRQGDLVAAARDRTVAWARERVGTPSVAGEGTPADPLRLDGDDHEAPTITATFREADAFAFAERAADAGRTWDLAVAAAFLDVVDPRAALDALAPLVPDGRLYAPITFDGVTAFAPGRDTDASEAVLEAYHATMHGPDRGGPRTGRALLEAVPAAGGTVVAAGGSDWVVTPPYAGDEAYFLHHLLDTVESAVGGWLDDGREATADPNERPQSDDGSGGGREPSPAGAAGAADALSKDALAGWVDRRHEEVAAGSLSFLAHNLDVYAELDG